MSDPAGAQVLAELANEIELLSKEATPGVLKLGTYGTDLFVREHKNGEPIAKLFDVRGWGYFTGKGGGLGLSDEEAAKRQRANGEFVEKLWNNAPALVAALRALAEMHGAHERYRQSHIDNWKAAHPGQEFGDVHAAWWQGEPPAYEPTADWAYRCTDAVVAALLQEGVTAWHGDATGIITHMITAQAKLRAEAESALARRAP